MRYHYGNIWSNTWNKCLEPILNWRKLKYGRDPHIFYSPPFIIIYTLPGLSWGCETNQEGRDKRRSVLPINSGIKPKGSTPILWVQSSRNIPSLSRGYRSESYDTFLPHRDGQLEIIQLWIFTFQYLDYIIKKIIPFTIF